MKFINNIGPIEKHNIIPLCPFVKSLESFVVKLFQKKLSQLSWKFIGLIFLFLLFIRPDLHSQEIKISERIIAIAEELAADESDPAAAELFSELLFELADDPVIINSGDEKEISRLFFLTEFQVKVLADYVKTSGRILSPFEIANIPGFDRESAEMLIPFVSFEIHPAAFIDSARFRQTLLVSAIHKTTVTDPSAPGSPWRALTRYKFQWGNLSGGFTAEKDPGEKFLSGKIPLPDFYSGYLIYKGSNILKRIIIGDYSVRFGLGTNINSGLRTGLSLTTPGNFGGRSEIRPYTSTDENNFFRGAAAEFSIKNLSLILFYSDNRIDATLNNTADPAGMSVKSLYRTGLHTDSGAILKKDALRETGWGANLSYNFRNLRTGIALSETGFSLPLMPDISDPANKYDFTGRKNTLYTIYYNSLIRRFILFGEFSLSGMKGHAFVQGVSLRPADRLSINLLYRNYSPGYVSFHANGPASGSGNGNEYGIFGNFTFEAAKFLFISAGSDVTEYPWLRYRCSSPSLAKRHEIRIRYLPSQKLAFETIYNSKSLMVNDQNENGIPRQIQIVTQSVRGSAKYSPSEYLTFITRADYKIVSSTKSKGMLLLQDINLRFRGIPVSIWMRFSIYNTGGFESGIYTWENDLLNSFSIPVMYGNGNRRYIMASWKTAGRVELRIKYGVTSTSVINGRMKDINDFRIQCRLFI
jgi:hypothetical protein